MVKAMSSNLVMMDATVLSAAIRARDVSCVEVMSAHLDHIEALNGQANAIVSLGDRETLLMEAQGRDTLLARGRWLGPLHGFPHAVKDTAPVQGMPMTMGSPLLASFHPQVDGIIAERLKKAGAVIIGKTNVPEFALGSHTYNPVFGATPNAYDASRSSGGSSGGAAVALALRMVPLADGSDLGGSLRNPAGWNNVFGFRPSIGVVPGEARDVWLPSMSVAGPMARTVPDLTLLLSVLAGDDGRVPLSFSGPTDFLSQSLERDFKGARIAWTGDFGGAIPFDPGVLPVCEAALKAFEAMGCIVEEAFPSFSFEQLWQAFLTLRAWQVGAQLAEFDHDPAKRRLLKPEAVFEVERGRKLTAFEITAASTVRSEWYQAVRAFFSGFDFFVSPTAQVFPFPIETDWPREIAGRMMSGYTEWMKGMVPATMAGSPALAVPAGFGEHGLPMGLQIVGPYQSEVACLQLAHMYDLATGWVRKRLPPALSTRR